ncbi:MAG: hypothetical protein Hyperionvirus23_37 [Hyperionvirus sp.]|uniref:Uncharacterized protein n=1 Tax=Hyperionvirus sp. TaxID=2487770 RepID=A0A3G5AAV5_9VIRU|nr:MAG: hypothetical protein Hyperionvirus23_37 [Hyperionvirus sp.]
MVLYNIFGTNSAFENNLSDSEVQADEYIWCSNIESNTTRYTERGLLIMSLITSPIMNNVSPGIKPISIYYSPGTFLNTTLNLLIFLNNAIIDKTLRMFHRASSRSKYNALNKKCKTASSFINSTLSL